MPVFDIKYAQVYIRDGYRNTGAINNAGPYAIGTTTMIVDGFTTAPPAGSIFTIGTGKQHYKLTGTPTTTSLTFTPGLVAAGADNAVIHVIGNQIEVKLGEGTLTVGEKQNREYILNRGLLDEVRNGPETPMDVAFQAQMQFFTGDLTDPGGGAATIRDVLKKKGLASTWVSSDLADVCRPYSVDVEVDYVPNCSGILAERILLPYFRWEDLPGDLKAGTFNITGKCNVVEPTITRYDSTAA